MEYKYHVEFINTKREWWVVRDDGLVCAIHKRRANAINHCKMLDPTYRGLVASY